MATNTSVPTATPTSSGSTDPVVMAAGDIACDPSDHSYNGGTGTGTACMQLATSNELTTAVAVLPLGDNQYNSGTLSAFDTVYDPTWGRFKSTTYPASGNHEYEMSGAAGYYTYFGSAASPQDSNCTANCKGYYSYDLGAWHLIVLNSECDQVGGCNAGSPQEQWLKADLAAHATVCTLAYWHRPLFTSGISLGDSAMHDVWADLYNAHADLVLNAHDHIYERFAPQDPSGNADPTNGITEIIVGTGGVNHDSFSSTATHSVVRDNTTYGVLKLTLHPTSFAWQFLPETASGNGTFTDAGSRACH
jgi:acid phosphatase type 7